jgi:3-dehydroquinate synthetase
LQKVNLPITISSKIDYQDFIDAMSVDKKAIGGEVRLVLMKKIPKNPSNFQNSFLG